jgi:hypothetical protein
VKVFEVRIEVAVVVQSCVEVRIEVVVVVEFCVPGEGLAVEIVVAAGFVCALLRPKI